ncbi:MAG: CoA transferase [Dehalococcoidia bacterium]|nr:CoA transferase [Dehalococcoidia bacterium]
MALPLEGIRVIDSSQIFAGPGAAMYLGDQGADVIKIEPPGGDPCRGLHTSERLGNMSKPWLIINRNKRSIVVDIRTPDGREIVHRLVGTSDVFIHNYRLGVDKRLGVDYETLSRLNPRLVYLHVTGFGKKGPFAHTPAYDLAVQARAGILGARRLADGTPIGSPIMVSDLAGAMLLAYGVTLALFQRTRTGRGQTVESSLLNISLAMQSYQLVQVEGENTPLPGSLPNALYSPYKAADNEWLMFVCITDAQWHGLCRITGLEHLGEDPAFDTYMKRLLLSPELQPVLDAVFATKPRAEWLNLLQEAEIPSSPIQSREEVFADPQVLANDMITTYRHPVVGNVKFLNVPLELDGIRGTLRRPAPTLGQHTDEVMAEMGFSPAEVKRMRAAKVVA